MTIEAKAWMGFVVLQCVAIALVVWATWERQPPHMKVYNSYTTPNGVHSPATQIPQIDTDLLIDRGAPPTFQFRPLAFSNEGVEVAAVSRSGDHLVYRVGVRTVDRATFYQFMDRWLLLQAGLDGGVNDVR